MAVSGVVPFNLPRFTTTNRSTFCHDVNLLHCRETNGMPSPGIDLFGGFHRSSSHPPRSRGLVVSRFGGESKIQFLPSQLEIGKSMQNYLQQAPRLISLWPCQVKSEDSETKLSGENILLDQQTLERDLQIAIEEEDYAQAAKIRDSLRILHEDSKASVLAANARFYNSFRNGDLAGMQSLWAPGDHVCCVHPGVPVISGYDLVVQSWEYVLADYEFPLNIELKDVLVHVRGDLGYVTCVEFIKTKGSSWGRQNATNVFERVNGQWFICVHQASRINT